MNQLSCECESCTCTFQADQAVQRNGQAYCSQACADQHPDKTPCPSASCHCEQNFIGDGRTVSEDKLDNALDETFPASDPTSP